MWTPTPALAEVLVAAQQAGQARIEELARGGGDAPGGWSSALHAFDYNLDHLGLGTIDATEWKIPDRAKAYVMWAMAARAGLWGNHGYEADYAFAWTDGDGQPLDGANRYELRLESTPPAGAFRPIMRMYQPLQPILDGTYVLPAVRKLG